MSAWATTTTTNWGTDMKALVRTGAAIAATLAMVTSAAVAGCIAPMDMAALRTAAMQQELMVAAFSCHEIRSYNRFVIEHRAELQASDARLKAYFTERSGRGVAGYHLFKTELANSASLRSIRNTEAFCADAGDTFAWAFETDTLSRAISEVPVTISAAYRACEPDGPFPAADRGRRDPSALDYRGRGGRPERLDDDADLGDADDAPLPPRHRGHHDSDLGY